MRIRRDGAFRLVAGAAAGRGCAPALSGIRVGRVTGVRALRRVRCAVRVVAFGSGGRTAVVMLLVIALRSLFGTAQRHTGGAVLEVAAARSRDAYSQSSRAVL